MSKRTDNKAKLQNKIVEKVSNMDLKSKLREPKTAFGRAMQNRAIKNFERTKLNTLKNISKRQQGIASRAIDSVKGVTAQILASETAKDLSRRNSYQGGLSAWMDNIDGNPDPDKGEKGTTQSGSTSELGG